MINRLIPEQISVFWDSIKFGIAKSAAPDVKLNHGALNVVLQKLLTGTAQCWLVTELRETGPVLLGCIVTYIKTDDLTERKNLLVYALYSYEKISDLTWAEVLETLRKFAEAEECDYIVGYTTNMLVTEKL